MSSRLRRLDVDVLRPGADRVDPQPLHVGDGDRVVPLVHAQEPDLEGDRGSDLLVDEVRHPGVEHRVEVGVKPERVAGGDGHVPHALLAGDPAGSHHVQRLRRGERRGEDLLHDALGSGEAPQSLHAAQGRLLRRALGDRDATFRDAADDAVEGLVVVDLPAHGHQVLGRAALDEEAALPVVEPEPHDVVRQLVDVETDRVGAEAPPVGEPLRLDHDVAQVHGAEDGAVGVGTEERCTHRGTFLPGTCERAC